MRGYFPCATCLATMSRMKSDGAAGAAAGFVFSIFGLLILSAPETNRKKPEWQMTAGSFACWLGKRRGWVVAQKVALVESDDAFIPARQQERATRLSTNTIKDPAGR